MPETRKEIIMDWLSILCDLILPVLGLVLTVLVVPWLRETRAWKYVQLAVRAAEQLFGGGTGPEKYEYVQGLLASKFRLSDDEAQRLIEAAVRELESAHRPDGRRGRAGKRGCGP